MYVYIYIYIYIYLPVQYLDLYFFNSHMFCKNLIFIVGSKKSNNHDDQNDKIMLARLL